MSEIKGLNIGFGICGSFCTIHKVLPEMKKLVDLGANVFPYMSYHASTIDTRFGKSKEIMNNIENITNNKVITTIEGAEPIGPQKILDAFIVAPCTGNTLGKLANGIIDTCILMAVKATLRNLKPVIIGIATNDGLSFTLNNVGTLLKTKNIYFVPFGQDNYIEKPNSLVSDMKHIEETLRDGINKIQYQPVLLKGTNKDSL